MIGNTFLLNRILLLVAAAGSSLLYLLAFPPADLPEAAYVFAVPLLLVAAFLPKQPGEGWLVFGAAWISWALLLSWLRHATGHLAGGWNVALGYAAVLGLAAVMALFWWAWMLMAMSSLRRATAASGWQRLLTLLALAAMWVLLEWLRGWLFTGFPWLTLAASQWQRPLVLQVIALTGAHGLSFILILFNLGLAVYLWSLWSKRRERWWRRFSPEFYLALTLLFGAIGVGLQFSGLNHRGRIDGPALALVQPNLPALEKWDADSLQETLEIHAELSEFGSFLGADWILWPEAPFPLPAIGNDGMRDWIEALSERLQRPLLIGNMARVGEYGDPAARWYNTVFEVQPDSGLNSDRFYAKRRLVPFGEYVPLAAALPWLRTVVPVPGDFARGTSAEPIHLTGFPEPIRRVGLLICYEDIFPQLARANTMAGADWHFVVTNNAWFGEAGGAYQHAAHAVLRAVETRRPVVRCGNAGWSGWIDEFGQVRFAMRDQRGSIYFRGVQTAPFSVSSWWNRRQSLYVRWGDWFLLPCALLILPLLLPLRRPAPSFTS